MFVSSRCNRIILLPGLPAEWKRGGVHGLRAKGGFVITNLEWQDSLLNRVSVYSLAGSVLNLEYGNRKVSVSTVKNGTYSFDGNLNPLN